MVTRVLAVPDSLTLARFDEVFCAMLGREGLGYNFHIHGQEFTRFLRRTTVLNDELDKVFRRWYPLFRVPANAA